MLEKSIDGGLPEPFRKYLEDNNMVVISLQVTDRFQLGHIKQKSSDFFIKISKNESATNRLKNEFSWNKFLTSLSNQQSLKIGIARVFDFQSTESCAWYVSEFISGSPLVERKISADINKLISQLDLIVEVTRDMLSIDTQSATVPEREPIDFNPLLLNFKKIIIPERPDLEKHIQYFDDNKQYLEHSFYHGDYRPWQFLFDDNSKLWLVDWEQARKEGIKYYDLAMMYHQIYTELGQPEVAHLFLSKFKKIHNFDSADEEQFRILLMRVVIGGYYENISLKKNLHLQDKFLSEIE